MGDDEVTDLLDRIASGQHSAEDIARLRQQVSVRGNSNRVQVGRHNIDISGGHDIRIGDHVYHGADATAVASAVREALGGGPPPPPSRLYILVVSIGFLICIAAFGTFGYALFTDTPDLEPGGDLGPPEGVVIAGAMFLTGFVIIALATVVRAIVNPSSVRGRHSPWH